MIADWSNLSYESLDFSVDETKVVCWENGKGLAIKEPFDGPNHVNLVSKTRKVLLPVHGSYFHLLTETMAIILEEMEKSPDPIEFFFIVFDNFYQVKIYHIEHVIEYINKQIQKNGHSASIVTLDGQVGAPLLINNFSIVNNPMATLKSLQAISKFLLDGIDTSVEPQRKIYLSRGKTLNNSNPDPTFLYEPMPFDELEEKYKYANKTRIDDEKAIEDYMRHLGYEIIYPEELGSFEEQLKLMVQVRSLASITGAGMTSLLFMKPGSKIIEFLVPLATPMPMDGVISESIHPHYYNMSYTMKHSYINVPHQRVASELIQTIETTAGLKDYIAR